MVLNFQDFKKRKAEKQSYRDSLVNKIVDHYSEENLEKDNSFYLEHVRTGFPIHVLEGILERLEENALVNSHAR
ncbi:hypothetical protein [Pseudobacteriovorax antillogorgiicola]|uniref:Uncharacterized protein n=1 Tax=Pseudobacteriovorax antillogorgiicola TaxID=1513793 RepID=A0A1Y6CI49_9BACT|nr:hypothetical protein [Pseudobacteriovorax antillogorgiicola]TCS48351.1 hypothetical protein EDD56_118131 [Pseudobacteriovorax antillogorgiicola]SMF56274.1 hypothetical protein SAMN06296036_11810 [Pseudobacteriovorax antillogorgiicola]